MVSNQVTGRLSDGQRIAKAKRKPLYKIRSERCDTVATDENFRSSSPREQDLIMMSKFDSFDSCKGLLNNQSHLSQHNCFLGGKVVAS